MGNNLKASHILIGILAVVVIGVLAALYFVRKPTPTRTIGPNGNPPVARSVTNPPVARSVTNPPVARSVTNPPVARSVTNPPVAKAVSVIKVPHINYKLSRNVIDLDAMGIKPLKISDNQIVFSNKDNNAIAARLAVQEQGQGQNPNIPRNPVLLSNRGEYALKVTAVNINEDQAVSNVIPAPLDETFLVFNRDDKPVNVPFNQHTFHDIESPVAGISFNWLGDHNAPVEPLEIDIKDVSVGPLSIKGSPILTVHQTYTPQIIDNVENGKQIGAAYDCELKGNITIKATAGDSLVLQPMTLGSFPIGTVKLGELPIYAHLKLEIQSGVVEGDITSNWTRTERFDVHAVTSLVKEPDDLLPTYNPPSLYYSHLKDNGNNINGSFLVDIMPIKLTLRCELTGDPTDASTSEDGNDNISAYIDLRSDIRIRGLYDINTEKNDFLVHGIITGEFGLDWGILHPKYSFGLYDRLLYPPSQNVSPVLPHRPHHRRRRRHHARSNYGHIDAAISNEIQKSAAVLKSYPDVVPLKRDERINHVTINSSREDTVEKGSQSISAEGLSNRQKASVAHNFGELYDTGKAVLGVRNAIKDHGYRGAAHGNRIRLLRRARSYTKKLRHSNKAIVSLKRHISSEKAQPSVKPGQGVNPPAP